MKKSLQLGPRRLFCPLSYLPVLQTLKKQNKIQLPKTQWQQKLTFSKLGDLVSIFTKMVHGAHVRNVSFYICEHQRYHLLQPNLQSSTPREKPMLLEMLTATSLAARRKLLHSLSPAVITYVQVYNETKIHITVVVAMDRRKAFVTRKWEENGCRQTELNISYKQTSLYFLLLKKSL